MTATVVCVVFLLPSTLAAGWYLLLTALGRRPVHSPFPRRGEDVARNESPAAGEGSFPPHLTVLIPAHDEEGALPRTLASLSASHFPASRLRTLVIADNCTDGTARVARRVGADCVQRTDPANRGKGHAVAFGLAQALAEPTDAVLILDADCTIDAGLVRRMCDELTHAEAVQAAVVSRTGGGPGGYVAAVGTAIDNAAAAGADRLGLRVPLRGTGMLFRRSLLERHPWAVSGLTEDAEYEAVLRRAGVRVRFVADRGVYCDPPEGLDGLLTQRRRWRAALRVPGRGLASLLASKPLVLAHLLLSAVAVGALAPPLLGWVLVPVLFTAAVYGSAMAKVGWPRVGLLVRGVGVVARLGAVAVGGLWARGGEWRRTPRS
jgi:cellulose synthase/poly-beta-1,6-N-acetylglucosamine synthase-like glycosyltransferase